MPYPSVEAAIAANRFSDDAKKVLQEFTRHFEVAEKEMLRLLGWFAVGMLARSEKAGTECSVGVELHEFVIDRLHPYTMENEILEELYDEAYWGNIKTPSQAKDHFAGRGYDDALVKEVAKEFLFYKGSNLLRYG